MIGFEVLVIRDIQSDPKPTRQMGFEFCVAKFGIEGLSILLTFNRRVAKKLTMSFLEFDEGLILAEEECPWNLFCQRIFLKIN